MAEVSDMASGRGPLNWVRPKKPGVSLADLLRVIAQPHGLQNPKGYELLKWDPVRESGEFVDSVQVANLLTLEPADSERPLHVVPLEYVEVNMHSNTPQEGEWESSPLRDPFRVEALAVPGRMVDLEYDESVSDERYRSFWKAMRKVRPRNDGGDRLGVGSVDLGYTTVCVVLKWRGVIYTVCEGRIISYPYGAMRAIQHELAEVIAGLCEWWLESSSQARITDQLAASARAIGRMRILPPPHAAKTTDSLGAACALAIAAVASKYAPADSPVGGSNE